MPAYTRCSPNCNHASKSGTVDTKFNYHTHNSGQLLLLAARLITGAFKRWDTYNRVLVDNIASYFDE